MNITPDHITEWLRIAIEGAPAIIQPLAWPACLLAFFALAFLMFWFLPKSDRLAFAVELVKGFARASRIVISIKAFVVRSLSRERVDDGETGKNDRR